MGEAQSGGWGGVPSSGNQGRLPGGGDAEAGKGKEEMGTWRGGT